MDNKTKIFDVQQEIAELKRRVEYLESRNNTTIDLSKISDWPTHSPIFGPNQSPPFCPPINVDWLKDFVKSDNKENKLD